MSQNESSRHLKEKDSKNKLLIIILIVAILVIGVLVGAVIVLLARPAEEVPQSMVADNRATIVTPENVDEVLEQAKEPVVAGWYSCEMNTEWHFKDSKSPSYDAYVVNAENNEFTVYFDLFLEETGELVYSSPYMEVGAKLDELVLTKQLAAGTYPAIVTYNLVDDNKEKLSSVSVTVTLYVEN